MNARRGTPKGLGDAGGALRCMPCSAAGVQKAMALVEHSKPCQPPSRPSRQRTRYITNLKNGLLTRNSATASHIVSLVNFQNTRITVEMKAISLELLESCTVSVEQDGGSSETVLRLVNGQEKLSTRYRIPPVPVCILTIQSYFFFSILFVFVVLNLVPPSIYQRLLQAYL